MEIKTNRDLLVESIQTVQNAVSQKTSLPILNNILLEGENNKITLTATDLDIGICSIIEAKIEQDGAITIPAKKFFDIIRALPENSEVNLSTKKSDFLTIKNEKAQFKIIGLPKEEFPQLPLFKDVNSVNIKQDVLKNMLSLTEFAISRDDTRFVLNGILFYIKEDKMCMVATDGRRLAVINKTLPQKTLVDKKVIIPLKTVQEIKRMLKEEGEVVIKFGDNQIMFSFPNGFILSRLIEGEYPDYKRVIPEKSSKEMKVLREELLAATHRASIFTDQDSTAIRLSIKKKRLTISKNTPYLGESREELDIDYTGDGEMEIGFNPRYLIDVLRTLSDKEIIFEVNDPNKPAIVRKGEEYAYVVLPMQLTA